MRKHNIISLFLPLLLCLAAPPAHAGSIAYTYDANGRLTQADYGSDRTIAYTYDNSGNLLKRSVSQGPTSTVYVSADGTCNGNTPCYATLGEAVSKAPDNALIKVAGNIAGNTVMDPAGTRYIEFGYDANFTGNVGGVTEIKGAFTAKDKTVIRSGTIRAK